MNIYKLISKRFGGEEFGKNSGEYKFGKIKSAKEEAMRRSPEIPIIDLGIGEPDGMPEQPIIDKLYEESMVYSNRGYADNGCEEFKIAAIKYMKDVYGVDGLDLSKEITHAIGSKNAFAFFPAAFIDTDDYALITSPGYPVLGAHTEWMGGKVYPLPLLEENSFLPDLDNIPQDVLDRAKILYLNYPNNPTGAIATKEFYKKVVKFAKENNVFVIADAAYGDLQFVGETLSFLSIEGAKEVGVEVHSLSKAFNMTGWRLAFVVGNSLGLDLFKHSKNNYDSGQFLAIQKAGVFALQHPEFTKPIREKYLRRHKKLVEILKSIGFDAKVPGGTFFLYLPIPKGVKDGITFNSGEDFCQYLIKELHISSVPWDEEGAFIRFSVTFETQNRTEDDVFTELKRRLESVSFYF
ncbi:LL-diaminopimelate aminotransferase [bacterium]|nr:LL-diaminopimelate aminotransferase [bacterium]